jgi:protein-disulfide isomerase
MKHVSWIVALVIGLAIGFVGRDALDGGRTRPSAGAPLAQPARPSRPVEDPRAVYRVPVDGSATKGPADALVTIVESSDFQCPFCKRGAAVMKQVEEAYRGKVRFVFKHNPLTQIHPQALPAALAVEEARAQGGDAKFWALHDKLFELAPSLDAASIERAAGEIGLDAGKVRAAIASGKGRERIERDQRLVVSVGAPGTPAFFINGRKLSGAKPFEAFRAVIDEELAKAEALVRGGVPAAQVYDRFMAKAATAPVHLPGDGAPERPAAERAAAPAAPSQVYRKVPLRADDPIRGPKDAKVTVVLFSDFECPFCSRVEPTLKRLEEEFPGQLRIAWKHQPLPMHANAIPAALAAEAAREQGKFWAMHEKLFQDQRALTAANLERYAAEIGLDVKRFRATMEGKKHMDRVKADQELAGSVGATGTPTMFFNCRQVVGARPFEQLRPVVEEELKKAEALLAGRKPGPDFYEKACAANVENAPAPVVVPAAAQLGAGALPVRPDDPMRGNPRAPVTVVLFSDFQCPFCSRVNPTLQQVERAYGDKVRVVWKHQPLAMHAQAVPAAEAAEAAREQGKFWQMHDKLFQNQRGLSDAAYEQFARELGLDLAKFQAARRSGRARARIQEDQALASRVGANGTPTMFVNGVKVEGAVPFERIKAVIDEELARKK